MQLPLLTERAALSYCSITLHCSAPLVVTKARLASVYKKSVHVTTTWRSIGVPLHSIASMKAKQATNLFVQGGTTEQGFLDSLGDIPALLPEAHQVGVQRSLAGRPPQLGDEVSQGGEGGDEGGL